MFTTLEIKRDRIEEFVDIILTCQRESLRGKNVDVPNDPIIGSSSPSSLSRRSLSPSSLGRGISSDHDNSTTGIREFKVMQELEGYGRFQLLLVYSDREAAHRAALAEHWRSLEAFRQSGGIVCEKETPGLLLESAVEIAGAG